MSSKSRTGRGTGCRTGCRTGFSREEEIDFPPDSTHPAWSPYRDLLSRLPAGRFPDAADLTALLPPGLTSGGGAAIRFVPASSLSDVDYEREIYESGQVSTREHNWHDLFNALVWCRLPRLKVALNAQHYRHLDEARDGRRGPVRDALTLLDESGALVVSSDRSLLEALAARDWYSGFGVHCAAWGTAARLVVCGHSLLEKLLHPYKGITAQTLLLHVPGAGDLVSEAAWFDWLDRSVAGVLLEYGALSNTRALSPVPLAGVPGWWSAEVQDEDFYSDRAVFRALRRVVTVATVHALSRE